jgi:hypothetical protein
MSWFAVRHVIKNEDAYEERITLWQATTFEEAIGRAEAEVVTYAWEGTQPLGLYQAFELEKKPGDGDEVFSLIRRSPLAANAYLDEFFSTGSELQTDVDP